MSSPQRLEALPDLPTVAESGYKGFEADQWYGVVAPAGTPPEIVAKPTTPEAFGEHIVREIARWKPVIQSGRVKAD